MNYYEHHIRDYDAATSHLTWDEDLAYTRLIRWYYRKEQPIPADIKEACRQVRATSKLQRDAVDSVLREFFDLREDGWHNETCDDVIARFKDGEPEREVKKANEENRMKRHRDERARLFKMLTDAGEHAPWNIKMEELRELVGRVSGGKPVTEPETKPATPATAPATPATATQTPDTSHQTPELTSSLSSSTVGTPAGAVCARLKSEAGLLDVNPQHPKLLALLDAGITDDELVAAAHEAKQRGKGFAYAMATAEGRRRDAANTKPLPAKTGGLSKAGQATAEAAARWLESQGAAQ